jgi:hypothetical protein
MGTEKSELNPEIIRNVDLPDLDEIIVVVMEVRPFWWRCLDLLIMRVLGSSVVAATAAVVGFFYVF